VALGREPALNAPGTRARVQVCKDFERELKDCLEDKVRRMDNQLHLRKHKG
jgi:hypothetical protein